MDQIQSDKSNVAKIIISVFNNIENIVGKGKKCWLPAFSPFPTMFSKGFFFRIINQAYKPQRHKPSIQTTTS